MQINAMYKDFILKGGINMPLGEIMDYLVPG